jgi:tRNA-Thr(GGU) m(6)t(6)A37 methyltransferase TsaA
VTEFVLRAIGRVESPLRSREDAPRQGDEGTPEAVLAFDDDVLPALRDVSPGAEYLVLTWLHMAERSTMRVHPRGDLSRPEQGVFSTRSPDRPNPIGLHRVRILAVDRTRLRVSGLEAIDGTPIVDLKPVLGGVNER